MITEVNDVKSYYSGHYEAMGFNCQAVCDSRLIFLYFGVLAPGKWNNNAAHPLCKDLRCGIGNIAVGLYFVGDAANLLDQCIGSQKSNPDNDEFNFYLSQLRIRIEMAFGTMVNKFRVLKKKLDGLLAKRASIVMACARLHNYINTILKLIQLMRIRLSLC